MMTNMMFLHHTATATDTDTDTVILRPLCTIANRIDYITLRCIGLQLITCLRNRQRLLLLVLCFVIYSTNNIGESSGFFVYMYIFFINITTTRKEHQRR